MCSIDKKLLKEEEKRKTLGDFYVPMTCIDKNEFIKAINGFINSVPTFKPFVNIKNFRNDNRITKYIDTNDLRLLKREFFAKKIYHELNDTYYNGNRLEIAVGNDGVKHIIIARNNSRNANELSNKLGIETIRAIYKNFVYDVESLTSIIRELKEMKTFFESLTYPCYFKTTKRTEEQIFIIHNCFFNVEEMALDCKISCYSISNDSSVKCSLNNTNMKSANLEFIKEVYNEKNIINKEMFTDLVMYAYTRKIERINEQMNEMINRINNI